MRNFSGAENWVRKHFFIYRVVRRAAPFICKYIALEDGFEVLKYITPTDSALVALDIGANDGTSIRMIRKFQKSARVIAFDPVTRPRFNLRNVDFKEYALSNTEEMFSLFTPIVHGKTLTQYSSFHSEKLRKQIEHDLGLKVTDYGIVEKNLDGLFIIHNHPDKINSKGGNTVREPVEKWIKGRDIVSVEKTDLKTDDIEKLYQELKKYKYDFINFNCEHFVNFAKDKNYVSPQVLRWTTLALIGLGVYFLIKNKRI